MKKEVYAKKKFGQNFLKDNNIINKILKVTEIKNNNIVEIGPGRGALTKELVKESKHVIAFEIDQDMVNVIQNEIKSHNLTLVHEDFLKSDLSSIEKSKVIANIPYYITTDILFKIFEHRDIFSEAILMVQKEVAERIVAKENSKEYSKLSLSSQFLANTKIEFIVPKNAFSPAPKVDSAIISLKFYDNIDNSTWNLYKDFFKLCFNNRRKKLITSLKTVYSSEKIINAYNKLGYDENLRIQQLPLEKIVELYKLLNN
ncbi:16S rRNA (adenine(1518)-N(6)/adenine(1519)-N(6))-dimethyltransferase RsmA [Mycoplasma sp. CSL10137]|uniref:16S rRNA (adenine(1518)-N(6)/adenine(1519)-N(6))- dimethyltransferase RsmA n=1 Tax=unclassified Mycoplasma TaxID=2683645 RepID=UPI00197BE550|nr:MULTISPECIES: 16S rRNA (adenine(1518)-N(6)/adenine(1519)-N(6))-dimethyltransferase RsmA [unclassified Mycoplasma]MBN4083585.1 16S rRNA (adenine(1518)-N(6)/adenine(1519)-N(6))-dimethyltransferase RsmA [Mycoplasma sp. CSL10137]MBN4084134.1 16S rRNA (adenine(1518)-N(6)/adenine(1519)-N(6))-dimethyltransferase RsmA [Mycoplasma sp. CSL10166]MBU4692599.1 16S rRNA (adenine(1518)-N(6)/adenine(1519)-N(6))-dimethyltransferase RsmA [Mycoplasma sp. CSL7491-lung]